MKLGVFASGCFWCTEAVFKRLKGVSNVKSGYTGGFIKNPPYREVCQGITGHAEGISFNFNESLISYVDLLEVFFATHDPTTLNRQANDVGTQYRSAIFHLWWLLEGKTGFTAGPRGLDVSQLQSSAANGE